MIVKLKDVLKRRKKMHGGQAASAKMAVTPERRTTGSHFKAAGRVTLDVGTRIGLTNIPEMRNFISFSGEGL